jgi:hypothetical protein
MKGINASDVTRIGPTIVNEKNCLEGTPLPSKPQTQSRRKKGRPIRQHDSRPNQDVD